jgi:uncharacterized protein YjiK
MSCNPAGRHFVATHSLNRVGAYPLQTLEPSGLCLSENGHSLWTVSDSNGEISEISFEGAELRRLKTGLKDVEGVAALGDSTLALILERSREIVIVDLFGREKRRAPIDIQGLKNEGLEGIAFDRDGEVFYVLKEKSPGLLVVLNQDMEELSRHVLTFAMDYSSIEFEPVRKHLWVMSDESRSIHVFDLNLKQVASFDVNVRQPEGLAVDYKNKKIYVVSDNREKLYVFTFADY